MAFVYEVVILARSRIELEEVPEKLIGATKKMRYEIKMKGRTRKLRRLEI